MKSKSEVDDLLSFIDDANKAPTDKTKENNATQYGKMRRKLKRIQTLAKVIFL